MLKLWMLAGVLALAHAVPAAAQEDLRFCPNRPSLGASGCTTRPGQVQVEWSSLEWERLTDDRERSATLTTGVFQLRVGVGAKTEVQIGGTLLGQERSRDASGGTQRSEGVGDLRLGVRQNLTHPDGKKLSIAVEPFLVLPVGTVPIGGGDWAAGAVLPVSYALPHGMSVAVTAEMDAAVDEDGKGRHLAYSLVSGIDVPVGALTFTTELMVLRDRDPAGAQTQLLGAESVAWTFDDRAQLDLLVAAGLNHNAPDMRLALGGAIVF